MNKGYEPLRVTGQRGPARWLSSSLEVINNEETRDDNTLSGIIFSVFIIVIIVNILFLLLLSLAYVRSQLVSQSLFSNNVTNSNPQNVIKASQN